MIISRIYETQNLLSLWLVSFLFELRTYQHPCIGTSIVSISLLLKQGTVNGTGNGRDWVTDSQHIQIAFTLLVVKGRL